MKSNIFYEPIKFLSTDIGLSKSAIDLGIRLSKKNKTSLPITLWSYGLINIDELDRIYNYLWNS